MLTMLVFIIGWLIGLIAGEGGLLGPLPAAVAAGLGLAGVLVGWKWPLSRRLFLVVLGIGLGAGRLLLAQPDAGADSLAAYRDCGAMVVRGVVSERPDILADEQRLRLRVNHIAGEGVDRDIAGDLLVYTDGYPRYAYGDELTLKGELQAPPRLADFDYPQYLARQGILALMRRPAIEVAGQGRGSPIWAALYRFKDHLTRTATAILPAPQGPLLAGMLVGDRSGIPDALMEDFRVVGVSHIIVISGWNVTVLAGLVTALCTPLLGRRPALWIALGVVFFYTALVGFDPPVARAAIMGGLTLLALLAGRQSLALHGLALSALLMTAWRPHVLWDLGFQLSFAATAGLILFAGPLSAALHALLRRLGVASHRRLARLIDDTLVVTLAAQILVLPLLIYRLGELSLLMLPANLLILPIAPAALGLGALATLAGLLWQPLGWLCGWCAWPLLTFIVRVTEWLAGAPLATVRLPPASAAFLVVYYGAALAAAYLLKQDRQAVIQFWLRVKRRPLAQLGAPALLLAVVLVWSAAFSLPDGKLHVYFLDVGQGDAVLVQTPSGRRMLVDGGPDGPTTLAALGRRLPFWTRRLDVVLATHEDADHTSGLFAALERYQVDVVMDAGFSPASETGQRWAEALAKEGAQHSPAVAGARVSFSDGVEVEILHPPADAGAVLEGNDRSAVARLTYGDFSLLLMGDLEKMGEEYLLESGQPLASHVLKAAHHGAATGTSVALLEAVAPAAAIISVGAGNRFGHPAPATLRRLEDRHVQVWRTDEDGEIELISDGERLWVKSRR